MYVRRYILSRMRCPYNLGLVTEFFLGRNKTVLSYLHNINSTHYIRLQIRVYLEIILGEKVQNRFHFSLTYIRIQFVDCASVVAIRAMKSVNVFGSRWP
jgi:hypothetical protein